MSRFISPISAYGIQAVHQKTERLADGTSRVLKEGFYAQFKQSDTTDWEREVARTALKFKGTTMYADGSPVDPITRVSSFDTNSVHATDCSCPRGSAPVCASCKTLKEQVEVAMRRNDDFGKQDGYILVEKPQVPAPWPTYDELTIHGRRTAEHVAAKNLETAATTGVPIDALVAYERQLDPQREDVIAAYEAAAVAPEAEQPELVEA